MDEIGSFEKILWVIVILMKVGLLALLLSKRNYRAFPFFFAYMLITTMQSGILVVTYQVWGFRSSVSMGIYWSTQFVVILARGLAVAEICWRALRKYRGIWALAWRVLVATGVLVLLLYAVTVVGLQWVYLVLNVDRGLELTIATVLAMLFLFAHHYEMEVEPSVRTLAIGFFLFSCFLVLNDTILEGWKYNYATLWQVLGTLAYLGSMLIWTWALRNEQPPLPKPTMMPVLGISNGWNGPKHSRPFQYKRTIQ